MPKKTVNLSLAALLIFTSLSAAETSMENEEIKNSWGVEINPLRLLDWPNSFSGGVSYFNYEDYSELTLPVTFNRCDTYRYEYVYENKYNYYETDLNIDLHYRKFLGSKIGGPYIGAFARYTYLDAKLKNDSRFAKVHKFGLGMELGFRYMDSFVVPNIYWGASLAVGKYFGNNNDIFDSWNMPVIMDDSKIFIDLELLKIGYEF